MQNYVKFLKEAGMSESRVYTLGAAVSSLHTELCKLDLKNLALFMNHGVAGNLRKFAEVEDLRDPLHEDFITSCKRALTLFDTEEHDFRVWNDKAQRVLEDMMELRVPGANLVYSALQTMRTEYENAQPIPYEEPEDVQRPRLIKWLGENFDISRRYEANDNTTYVYLHDATGLGRSNLETLLSYPEVQGIGRADGEDCLQVSIIGQL